MQKRSGLGVSVCVRANRKQEEKEKSGGRVTSS